VRRQVCAHLDGLAIGSTLAALDARGWFEPFARKSTAGLGELLAHAPGNTGYLQAAMKALADLGWFTAEGPEAEDARRFTLTPRGRTALDLAWRYEEAAAPGPLLIEGPRAWRNPGWHAADALDAWELLAAAMQRGWDLAEDNPVLAGEVRPHLDAHLLAPLMAFLDRDGSLRSALAADGRLDLDPGRLGRRFTRVIGIALGAAGWASGQGRVLRLTDAGRAAARLTSLYTRATACMPLLGRAHALLFGDPRAHPPMNPTCLDFPLALAWPISFLALLPPIFHDRALAHQPRILLAIGADAGALLAAALDVIRRRTRRGPELGRHPLTLVAIAANDAERLTDELILRRLPAPGFALLGDSDNPAALARRLAKSGLLLKHALAVIRDSTYAHVVSMPRRDASPRKGASPATALGVDEAGRPIEPVQVAQRLTDRFMRWRPHVTRHGLITLTPHTTDPATAAQCQGRVSVAMLDILHAYSGRLLADADTHQAAACRAGFTPLALLRLGRDVSGYDALTAAWWRTDAAPSTRRTRSA
jgi:hypothetical protein